MNIKLRDPNIIMKLSRLGSFHQSRLSFLRSFLSEFKDWDYKRDLFDLNEKGYGTAVYSFKKNDRVYSLVCFANKINDEERSDRVIATKWDAAFTLHDGVPLNKDIVLRARLTKSFVCALLLSSVMLSSFYAGAQATPIFHHTDTEATSEFKRAKLSEQRRLFTQVSKLIEAKNWKRLRVELKDLVDYPLYPYLIYSDLIANLSITKLEKITNFLEIQKDSVLADRLRSKWLKYLALTNEWELYLHFYKEENASVSEFNRDLKIDLSSTKIPTSLSGTRVFTRFTRPHPSSLFGIFLVPISSAPNINSALIKAA